ncbi:MAG TPA: polysaccharide lyase family 7 protein, partial [Pseudoalteromonas sp.]|nr:polysaccharide lyase family 7 protein [Pseudoalteromonas sp.]
SAKGIWYPGCLGTGDWTKDKQNGDYAQVSFSKLELSPATPPTK